MKRGIALFLIGIFLFNLMGYYGIYAGMTHLATSKTNFAIENDSYDKAQTVTIKIPLALPYPIHNRFERVSGDFEYKGEFYKLVQQKHENDTMYVVCMRNDDQKKAIEVFTRLVKQSTSQSPASNQSTKTLSGLLKDYNPTVNAIEFTEQIAINIDQSFESVDAKILQQDYPVSTPPPNFVC